MMIRRRLFTTDARNMKERERIAHCCITNLLLLYSFFSLSKILKNTVAKYQFRIDGASLDEIDIANMMRKLARQSGSNITFPSLCLNKVKLNRNGPYLRQSASLMDQYVQRNRLGTFKSIQPLEDTVRPSAIWRTFVKINRGE